MKYIMVIISIMWITNTYVLAQEETEHFTEKGSMWFGGLLSLANFSVVGSDDRNSRLSLAPIYRYFPLNYFFVGPNISYSRYSDINNLVTNTYGFGGDIGYAKITKDSRTVGYLKTGLRYIIGYRDSEEISNGIELPVSIGVVFPIRDIICLNFEPHFTYRMAEKGGHTNIVSMALGFSMMRNKSLLTVLGK